MMTKSSGRYARGAAGYLLKTSSIEDIAAALRTAVANRGSAVAKAVQEGLVPPPQAAR